MFGGQRRRRSKVARLWLDRRSELIDLIQETELLSPIPKRTPNTKPRTADAERKTLCSHDVASRVQTWFCHALPYRIPPTLQCELFILKCNSIRSGTSLQREKVKILLFRQPGLSPNRCWQFVLLCAPTVKEPSRRLTIQRLHTTRRLTTFG
eukprot:COSAG02_NODE_1881_length_10542_cov_179.778991_2_plen_152_part_00